MITIAKKRKKKVLPPKRKRLKRTARLEAAKEWIKTSYRGSNIVRGYRNWFGVDYMCAVKELQTLGVEIRPEYIEALRRSLETLANNRQRRKLLKEQRRQKSMDVRSDHPEFGWVYPELSEGYEHTPDDEFDIEEFDPFEGLEPEYEGSIPF